MKLCIDCKYYNNDYCEHPNARSPVNGRSEIKCTVQRGHAWNQNFCRIQGHWFEPKPQGDTAAALHLYNSECDRTERLVNESYRRADQAIANLNKPWWKRIFS